MAYIILPHRWRRQPTQPVGIDWSHPLARGLKYAFIDQSYNRASGLLHSGGAFVRYGPNGREFTTGRVDLVPGADTAHRTVIGELVFTSNSNDYGGLGFGFYTGSDNNQDINVGLWAGENYIYGVHRYNGNGITTLENPITFPYRAVWGASSDGSPTGNPAYAYKNGLYWGNINRSGGSDWRADARTKFEPMTNSSGKSTPFAFMWSRVLSDAEHFAVYENPYQFFRPLQRRIYVPSAGTGGEVSGTSAGTFALSGSAAGQVSISGTSAATVSLTGTAAGAVAMSGTSAGSFNLAGAGVAEVLLSGSSAAQITVTGTAAGTVSGGLETRYGRPTTDTSAGAWLPSTGSDLYAMLDEETAEDSDYIYAESATVAVLKCTSLDTGGMTTPVLRAQVPTGFTANGTLTIGLYQGNSPGTLVAKIEQTDPAAGTYEHQLTAGEMAGITDGSDLYFRVTAA